MHKKLLLIAALVFTCAAIDSFAKPKAFKEINVQLYSVRELLGNPEKYAANHESVLKDLAKMGYTGVEAASYKDGLLYGVAPEQFKADVEAAGLKVVSSHVAHHLSAKELASKDFSQALKWWDGCIAAHKAAGMEYLVVPSMPRNLASLDELKVYCDYFNAIGAKCKEAGLGFGYHSHSFEFKKFGDKVWYDFMLENTDPELVFFQMDVYWAVYAQVSPVWYFNKYPGRFKVLHIKDWKEVGQSGMVGFDAIFANVGTAGTKDIIVEMEGSSVGDIMKTCKISVDYLKKIL